MLLLTVFKAKTGLIPCMTNKVQTVMGHRVPSPRATKAGLFWLASILSLPVFVVLSLVELAWRALF